MGLFKRAHVRGINHELVRQGLINWPNEKIAEEAADAVADEMGEEVLPEVSGEEGLSAEEAAGVIDKLVDVAEEIAEKTSNQRDDNFPKLAAAVEYDVAASAHATSLMQKAAAEAGTDVTGDGRFQEDMMAGGMGPIDAQKDPSSEKVVPQGTSNLDTAPGEVGAQEPQTDPPGASAPTPGEVAKLSALLEKFTKRSSTDPGSGDTGGTGHKEPPDNQAMLGVAPAQGKTTQPKGPLMGEQKPQPRTDSVSTSGEVAKLSSLLQEAITKISGDVPPQFKAKAEESKEEKKEEKKEESKEESEDDEKEKKAQLKNALEVLSQHVSLQ
jgi:hypothetical protein